MAKRFGLPICFAGIANAAVPVEVSLGEWAKFKSKHGKVYSTELEEQKRLNIFQGNLEYIEEVNAMGKSYVLGVTPFADLTFEEFRSEFLGGLLPAAPANITKAAGLTSEESVDWVSQGAVTPVKNQGHCGSCWTFGTTGALEGAMKVAGRELVSLSEQDLVDCDTGALGGAGCNGGNPGQAIGWVKSHGICSEEDDPYKCMNMTDTACTEATCNTKCTKVLKGGIFSSDIKDYGQVSQEVGHLETFVAKGPVAVAIEADTQVFQLYTGGVLTDDACGQKIDHAVLAVGYGEENGVKYWKVKNSWGADWGEDGYIRLARDKEALGTYGECGIRYMAYWVTVKSSTSTDNSLVV